ncbi:MAG: helix-turn-helix transcriptional regulator [Clostridia bacterium]|nr:helix-turn-helix transcriptional regulator [Clostridia bacterium]
MKTYFKHKLTNLISVSKIVTIHHFEFDKNFKSKGEEHDFWELVFAERESLVCTADGKKVLLGQGEVLFHKPNEYHTLSANGQKAPNVFIMSFECKSESMKYFEGKKIALSNKLQSFIYSILEEGKKTFDIAVSDPNLKKMALLNTPTLGGEQLIKSYLEIFLINLLREQTETEQGNATFLPGVELLNKPINDVTAILKENVYGNLSIDYVCQKTSYSKAYLFRIFKAKTGKTIMAYFIELKIDIAKQLLRENELSVKEIADKLSFNSPNYFTKTFKRIVKLTPLAYKKRHL